MTANSTTATLSFSSAILSSNPELEAQLRSQIEDLEEKILEAQNSYAILSGDDRKRARKQANKLIETYRENRIQLKQQLPPQYIDEDIAVNFIRQEIQRYHAAFEAARMELSNELLTDRDPANELAWKLEKFVEIQTRSEIAERIDFIATRFIAQPPTGLEEAGLLDIYAAAVKAVEAEAQEKALSEVLPNSTSLGHNTIRAFRTAALAKDLRWADGPLGTIDQHLIRFIFYRDEFNKATINSQAASLD